jgi:hypothetical protein
MSPGTIDGTGLIKSVWMSGIESPLGNPALSSVVGEWVFFGLGSWRREVATAGALSYRDSASVEKGNKSLAQGDFLPGAGAPSRRPIWSFARLGGFVIRCPLRTGFAYSSVAQR